MVAKITIRPWTSNDLVSLLRYANNPRIAKNMTDAFPSPYLKANGEAFLQMAMQPPIHIFAIDLDGEAVGGIGIHPQHDIHRKNAELGYWLAEQHWGKGFAVQAIAQILPIAFELYEIERIFARPFGTNRASQKVLEKSGFKLEARLEKTLFKNGQFVDELIYGFRK